MSSKMFIKDPRTGGLKTVVILRAWVDASGRQVFLHANGRYAYKDGSPLKSRNELDIIGARQQRETAQAWWDRTGEEESRRHYKALEEARREAEGDFRAGLPDDTDLDAVLYSRRPAGRKKGAVSAPRAWMEWFPKRPDWWGQASRIEFLDYVYERAEAASESDAEAAIVVERGDDAAGPSPAVSGLDVAPVTDAAGSW